MSNKRANGLLGETSPYLLQHAYNPVDWKPWNQASLKEARDKNKLLLISIGYAACHWCHVMEHETFEDDDVAAVMNTHFINIKVDREERPDVDQIYMDALQMMTGRGGWPLNIVALPDGRPFWGTTYLPKEEWLNTLKQISLLVKEQPEKVYEYADKLTEGIKAINLLEKPASDQINYLESLQDSLRAWSGRFDHENGGFKGAPKFMMPVNFELLLHYGFLENRAAILEHLHFSLKKMAYGGIYDQLGGGFSRYSVDDRWHVPHFEKMLYDNAQMIGLYARAYAHKKSLLYKTVIEDSVNFLKRELMHEEGAFYSSLDADSLTSSGQLEEGAYYRWTIEEVKAVVGADFDLIAAYFNLNAAGHWEEGYYVPIRIESDREVAGAFGISELALKKKIVSLRKKLLQTREERPRPRLDSKILCSWNTLLIRSLFAASRYLEDESYKTTALRTLNFLEDKLKQGDKVYHSYGKNKAGVEGFLEDYVGLLLSYLEAYEVTFNEGWLKKSRSLCDIIVKKFHDPGSGLFYFTAKDSESLIRRTLEVQDNVIPSSNSLLFRALFLLNRYYPGEAYGDLYKAMRAYLKNMIDQPYNYSNWLHNILWESKPFHEIVITGEKFLEQTRKMQGNYLPNSLFAGADKESDLLLLKNKISDKKSNIFICDYGACSQPVSDVALALEQINSVED